MILPIHAIDAFNPHLLFVIHAVNNKATRYTSEYHAHDFVELSIVTSGAIDYHIEGKDYRVEQGDMMLFNPGVYHQSTTIPNTSCTELHIGIAQLRIDKDKSNYIQVPKDQPILRAHKYKEEIQHCLQAIEKEQRVRAFGYTLVLKAKVMELVSLLYREMNDESKKSLEELTQAGQREKKKIVQYLIDYMNTHYQEEVSLEDMCNTMYLSPVYLSKIFKEETGTSPINYLIQIRLQKAKDLLEQEQLPIHVVARQVGYSDAYYFSKVFKKHYGMSPAHYVKQHLKQHKGVTT